MVAITRILEAAGIETWLVGGAVRDLRLGRQPKDYDLVVVGTTLEQVEATLKAQNVEYKIAGASFQTIKVGENVEIALARREESTGTGHTQFLISTEKVSLEEDLLRRDFTINAFATRQTMSLTKKTYDEIAVANALEDLHKRRVRCVGDPAKRFEEDPLRMLRAIQFAVRLDFEIEEKTWKAIVKYAPLIKTVSGERVFEELKKAWKVIPSNRKLNKLMDESGLGKTIFGAWDPIYLQGEMKQEDAILGYFMVTFLKAGDPSVMKPPTECLEYLEFYKDITANSVSTPAWKLLYGKRDKVERTQRILWQTWPTTASYLERASLKPLSALDLDIDGYDLMDLGCQGSSIGKVQRALVQAVWHGLKNERSHLIGYAKALESISI